MEFIPVLVFSFGFFGVWALKEATMANPPATWRPLLVGVVFLLTSWVLSGGVVKIG